ncbi:hypothetical protein Bbelb_217230 [Branchiostoma belcheri]|nr:hypothetical protein Bbelb_217230 [Branchiostoma belcheri]
MGKDASVAMPEGGWQIEERRFGVRSSYPVTQAHMRSVIVVRQLNTTYVRVTHAGCPGHLKIAADLTMTQAGPMWLVAATHGPEQGDSSLDARPTARPELASGSLVPDSFLDS